VDLRFKVKGSSARLQRAEGTKRGGVDILGINDQWEGRGGQEELPVWDQEAKGWDTWKRTSSVWEGHRE